MALERMSPVDTAWLHMDQPGNPADIVTLLTLDEQLPYGALKSTIERRLLKYERFRQRVTDCDGHPSWEDDDAFHIERHVTLQVVDAPLNAESLRALVADLGNQPLPMDRPLWAIHLVHGPDGGSAIIARLHHCIADGFALAHAMINLADRADGTPMSETMKAADPDEHEPLLNVLVHEANEIVRNPGHAIDLAKQGAALALSLGHLLFVPFDPHTFLKNKLSGRRRMAWSSGLDLDAIKPSGARAARRSTTCFSAR